MKIQYKYIVLTILFVLLFGQFIPAAEWDWEDGTLQGWKSKRSFIGTGTENGLENSTNYTYQSSRSLQYSDTGSSANTYDWYVYVESPNITPGDPVYFHVYIPAGSGISALKIFMKDNDGNWVDGPYYSADFNQWMELVITAPTNVPLPYQEIGIQVHASTNPADFTIYIDNVISGIPAPPSGLTATALDSTTIQLDWDDNVEQDFYQYYIYRSESGGFTADETTLLDSTTSSEYVDSELEVYHRYYYKLITLDSSGNASNPSSEVSVYLSKPGEPPIISVVEVNTTSPGLYEKFEALLNLQNANYANPFDPDEITVDAVFTSPTGKEWNIFGFYDDYESIGQWKLRFAPDELGTWTYYVIASESDGSDTTGVLDFEAVESEHHGWLRVSETNTHYFEYDNGSSFYGIGAYSPWGNSVFRFNEMESYGFNMFAIWNIDFTGFINGVGLLEDNLAEYNQEKCGRIDSMITIAEAAGIQIMYCIWPHNLFAQDIWEGPRWNANPYHFLCDVEEVYQNAQVWEYQKKKYRYMIGRFSYSRSWGIWEIINEMNGTNGWMAGYEEEAYDWVQKVDEYMKEFDPYLHPTTASFSGGYSEYRPELYGRNDIPNIHIYEHQSWPSLYTNPFRSSMINFANAARRFWVNFDKPAIFGEAGYRSYSDRFGIDPDTPEYTMIYHNALWASLSNGLSMAPIWWDYPLLSDEDFVQLGYLKNFVENTDILGTFIDQIQIKEEDYDLFLLKNDTAAAGWIMQGGSHNLKDQQFMIKNVLNSNYSSYEIQYFNTWTGEFEGSSIRPYVDNTLIEIFPGTSTNSPDVAFHLNPTDPGDIAYRLQVLAEKTSMLDNYPDSTMIFCYIFDDQGRFCSSATDLITFSLEGSGLLVGDTLVNAENGSASVNYLPSLYGVDRIIVNSPGLISDTVDINVKNSSVVDDFESYLTDNEIQLFWEVQSQSDIAAFIETTNVGSGFQSARFDYGLSADKTYAVCQRYFEREFSNDNKYIKFWFKGDGSNRDISIRMRDNARTSMEYTFLLNETEAGYKVIALEDFSGLSDLTNLNYLRITIDQGNGNLGSGTVYIDDIEFLLEATDIHNTRISNVPKDFKVYQNYPNPFNSSTTIKYEITTQSDVYLAIYNTLGQVVETFVRKAQPAGTHIMNWSANHISSGLYFYNIKAGDMNVTKKCILMK